MVELRPLDRGLAVAGGAASIVALAAAVLLPNAVLAGWLGAAVAIAAVPMGALILLMMMQLIPGEWGREMRLACEAGALQTPVAALAFLPVLIGLGSLYPWLGRTLSGFQAAYLSGAGFALRTLLWFAAVGVGAWAMLGRHRMTVAASVGLIFLVPFASLVAVDWLMSLDPAFASSGFGLRILSIEMTIAFAALLLLRLGSGRPPRHPGVLGGLLLTLLLLWAYLQFMPYFVIWSGNFPDGVTWYRMRAGPGWRAALWAASLLGGVPLVLLLFPQPRTRPRWLAALACAVIAGKLIEIAWLALPPLGAGAVLAYAAATVGLLCLTAAGLRVGQRWRVRRRAPA